MKHSFFFRFFFIVTVIVAVRTSLMAQWIQKPNLLGPVRSGAVSWVLNNRLYVVGGGPGQNLQEYDPVTNTWVVKAALPWGNNSYRYLAVGFTIGGKGYICTGTNGAGTYFNDLWMYDPGNNTWSAKAAFPGPGRVLAFAFSAGGNGFVGAGGDNQLFYADMYAYDPANNSWSPRSNFPGGIRAHVLGAGLGNYGYAGAGVEYDVMNNTFINRSDLFQYDPAMDSWSPVANIPGPGRVSGTAFASQTHLYAGFGGNDQNPSTSNNYSDLYKYDPLTDLWDTLPQFPTVRAEATGAFLAGKVYVATGRDQLTGYGDLWSFEEQTGPVTVIKNNEMLKTMQVFPNPAADYFEIRSADGQPYNLSVVNALGELIMIIEKIPSAARIDCSFLANGIYTIRISDGLTVSNLKLVVDRRE
jgi:N-acetylneuraminic acid mutarotase